MFKKPSILQFFSVAVLVLTSSVGCQSLPQQDTVPVLPTGVVSVGGLVTQPQKIEISPKGISLREVIALAGEIRLNNTPNVEYATDESVVKEIDTLIEASQNLKSLSESGAEQDEVVKATDAKLKIAETLKNKTSGKSQELVAQIDTAAMNYQRELEKIKKLELRRAAAATLTEQALIDKETKEAESKADKRNEALTSLKNDFLARNQGLKVGRTGTNQHLVALQRKFKGDSLTIYYPYELVSNEVIGRILLQDGDLVQVVDIDSTSLTKQRSPVKPPAVYEIRGVEVFPDRAAKSSTLGMLFKEISSEYTESDDRVIQLSRASISGIGRDLYVIPEAWIKGNGSLLGNASIQDGDVFIDSRLVQLPFVLGSIIESSREQIRNSKEPKKQTPDGRLNQSRNTWKPGQAFRMANQRFANRAGLVR